MRKLLGLCSDLARLLLVGMPNRIYYALIKDKSKVECNICHYKADKLKSDNWHQYVICPNCKSAVRHRLLTATFDHTNNFSYEKIIQGKAVLHFAPEKRLRNLIKLYAKDYKTADFLTKGYSYAKLDFNLDISNMQIVGDQTFDCVIACDVLEHVPDHLNGIKEVFRILKKGGHCIFTVPQRDNLKTTYEDFSITEPSERERVFGQFDHLRIYGDDFSSFMENSGFKVTLIDEKSFSKEISERNVLFPPIPSKRENATNFRKVFIGEK